MANAGEVLAAAQAAFAAGATAIDLAQAGGSDSAAIAVVLELTRQASTSVKPLKVTNLPANLASLAALYGIDDILPGA
jgi:phospholipid transport system transporter-binding protein